MDRESGRCSGRGLPAGAVDGGRPLPRPVILKQAPPVGAPSRSVGGPGNPHKLVFHADDVPAMREELVRRGAPMQEVETFGDLVVCDGRDPEGHRFQISNRK